MNLRFLPMSTALAPFFSGVRRLPLLFSSQVVSASSFIVPYLQFQKERTTDAPRSGANGYGDLAFFLGVGATAYSISVSSRSRFLASRSVSRTDLTKGSDSFCPAILPVCWPRK